nr:hypothetical protein [uncultured Agathobaculum sp.]
MKLTKNRAFQAHFFVPCIISEVHAPGNYEFAAQILFNAALTRGVSSRRKAAAFSFAFFGKISFSLFYLSKMRGYCAIIYSE